MDFALNEDGLNETVSVRIPGWGVVRPALANKGDRGDTDQVLPRVVVIGRSLPTQDQRRRA